MSTARPPCSARASIDAHQQFHTALLQVHRELRDASRAISAGIRADAVDVAATRERVAHFCLELLNHHKAEDKFIFPAFRRIGRLAAADLGFLAERDEEHVTIHRLCLELRDAGLQGDGGTRWGTSIAALSDELAAVSAPHFAEEERVLDPQHLRTMITTQELAMVHRDMGQNWNRR